MCFLRRDKEGKPFISWASIKLFQPLKLHKGVLNPSLGGMKFLVSLCCIACIFGSVVFSYGREKYIYDASDKRNPFIPLITSDGRLIDLDIVKKTKSLSIQGVICEPNSISYAIVNTAIVKEGDIVDGSQVIKIEKNKVSFIKDGEILELELKNGGEDEK